jgi:chitodextrinase
VSGYGLFRDGAEVATTSTTNYSFVGLACGTSYALGVDAYDAAGNRSTRVVATAATSPCADSQPPSAPSGLAQSAANETSATIAWQASTDNVGVAGYGVYQGGVRVDSTTARSYTVTGLVCGTTYTVAVDAYDAAGNRSAQKSVVVSTSACKADTVPPTVPTNQTVSQVTQSGFLMSWGASTDNVGVTGYNVYLNGARVTTVTALSYAYVGLVCGTTYTVAVEARDAAGNVSNRAEANGSASTAACAAPPPPSGGDAASYFVSPSGSDANLCIQAAPCASLERAYRVALPGQVVEVAGGTYPSQTIRAVPGKTAPNVVFRPSSGARVILGGLGFGTNGDPSLGPDFITVRGMETSYKGSSPGAGNQLGIHVGPGSTSITLEDMDAGSISSWFADHLTVRGGDYGPCDAVSGQNVCSNNKQDVSTNVLIEGAYFHDLEYDASAPGAHWECMYINGGRGVTIRGNRYERCAIFDVFVTISGPDAGRIGHENLTIENNFFAPATNGYGSPSRGWASLSLSWCQNASQPAYRNVNIRNNSFGPGAGIERDLNADGAGCRWQNVSATGNILAHGGCQNGWSYSNNLWVGSSSKCAASDGNLASLPYVNPMGLDYHLASGSTAEQFVPGTLCPATDIDGQQRNTPCAAGADER